MDYTYHKFLMLLLGLGIFSLGLFVNISHPPYTMRIVCSNCAFGLFSLTAVKLSAQILLLLPNGNRVMMG